jgi:two-component system, cell cycle sensor histidine kinase and response regulator CckA
MTTTGPPKVEKPLHLLVADDDPNDIELCLRELKRSGIPFHAETTSTRQDFVAKLSRLPVDVVLSDYRMKDWNGMDALECIRETRPGTPLILLSGTLGDDLAVDCIKRGVTDYVLKHQLARLPTAVLRAHEERVHRETEAQALESLRDSEARHRGLVNNATYGIYWVTLEGDLLDVNPAIVGMLGYSSAAEVLALGSTARFYRDEAARAHIIKEFRATGRVAAQVEWIRKDGQPLIVQLHGWCTVDPVHKTECAEVMVEDITDRVALEKQLVQAQKFEGIGQLAGGIAHDFNNMIGAILGWAEIGLEETETDSRLHRHFEKVRHQAERAAALTKQLLAFARRQILEPRDLDLNRSVGETIGLLERVIGCNIEIKARLPHDLALVRADPTQVEQVLINLCINARDAMPKGGTITIETSNVLLDESFRVLHPLANTGHYVVLSVTDTGTGMDSATLDRIFEPFFTTKELGKGTGLGLATVYGIVRQHGGFIQVYSEVGIGTTFRMYLPVSASVQISPERTEDSRPARGGSETLLVAEDHEGLRQLAHETLSHLGYRVVLASDGEEAIREFSARRNDIDLALLDVILPKLSGPDVYARISAEKPGLPVIFATGYGADLASLQKALEQGLPVIHKPYTPRDLGRKIRECLDATTVSANVRTSAPS